MDVTDNVRFLSGRRRMATAQATSAVQLLWAAARKARRQRQLIAATLSSPLGRTAVPTLIGANGCIRRASVRHARSPNFEATAARIDCRKSLQAWGVQNAAPEKDFVYQ